MDKIEHDILEQDNPSQYYEDILELADHYAQFQKAVSYGYIRQDIRKIEELNSFLNKFKKSTYRDDAYYVLANEYVDAGENQNALEKYDFCSCLIPE